MFEVIISCKQMRAVDFIKRIKCRLRRRLSRLTAASVQNTRSRHALTTVQNALTISSYTFNDLKAVFDKDLFSHSTLNITNYNIEKIRSSVTAGQSNRAITSC